MNNVLTALEDALSAINAEIEKATNRATYRKLDLMSRTLNDLWRDAYTLSKESK